MVKQVEFKVIQDIMIFNEKIELEKYYQQYYYNYQGYGKN